jgi:glycosyltransferase involved in cell wall biosynthesis
MRIIGLVNQTSGACYHRVYTPLMNMNADVHITNKLTEEQLEIGCDLLVINRFAYYNTLTEILQWKQKYHFKLVVDIDDYWYLGTGHILYDSWEHNNVTDVMLDYIQNADILTTTHERLATEIERLNKSVHILPNAIPGGFEQFNVNKIQSDKVRLMWQGSITHGLDMQLLMMPMKRVASDKLLANKINMVYGGNVPGITDRMVSAFTCGLKLNSILYEGMKPTEYYQIYNNADIAIIPLIENRFNSFKSNLKVLEAAYAGIPVIASQVNPYLNIPFVKYVSNQKDWYNSIKELVNDEAMQIDLGTNLKDYCDNHYNFTTINNQRKTIYES